jgi:pimeloyl-ACP methyl ester carboxylesterase
MIMGSSKFYIQFVVLVFVLHGICAAQQGTDNPDADRLLEIAIKDFQAYELKHGHSIQTDNVNMHYLTWGDPAGLPVVWVHGTGSDAYELHAMADTLTSMGLYVIAIDYYGHGQTPIPDHEVSIYHVADDIKFLIDHLGIEKVLVGGWSRGGIITTAFYDAYREHVLGIVLEDGGFVNPRRLYHKMGVDSMSVIIQGWFESEDSFDGYDSLKDAFMDYYDESYPSSHFFLLNSFRESKSGKWDRNPDLMEWLDEVTADGIMRSIFLSTQSPFFEYSTVNIEPRIVYRKLHVPMLILDPTSDTDWNMDFEQDNRLLTAMHPNLITHSIYENTGHAVKFQRQERFLNEFKQFVDTVREFHRLD